MQKEKFTSPAHLAGAAIQIMSKSDSIEIYDGEPPRFENGEFTLTNSFLQSIEEPLYLVVNGVIYAYEEQEELLYKKMASLTTAIVKVYPAGFEVIRKPLRLNARSIQRFQNKKIYTEMPIMIDADVTRKQLRTAFAMKHWRILFMNAAAFLIQRCCHMSIALF